MPSSVIMPDQRSEDVNTTSSRTVHLLAAGSASARALVVRFGVVAERASAASAAVTAGRSRSPSGTISSSVSRPVVRVPVLSVHTTSTPATASTAFTCCTSAPRPAIVAAPVV